MNIPVRHAVRKVFYFVLLVSLFQLTVAVPVNAVEDSSLVVDVTIPNGPHQLGDEFVIDIDVSNTADNDISAVQLQLPYDSNLLYVGGQNLPTTGVTQALLPIGDLASEATTQITITAKVRGIPRTSDPIPLSFQALAVESTSDIEEAELNISLIGPEPDSVSASGDYLEKASGHVDLNFPSGWYSTTATLDFELQELHQLTPDEVGTVLAFEVEASDSGAEIESFNAPITMTLAISDLVDLNIIPIDELYLRTREDNTESWTGVPFTITQGILQFETMHFSEFELGGGDPEPWKLTYNPPGVSAYTGAANYSYPFSLPPGRGGLTPSLGLYYGSRGVDGLEFPVMSRGPGSGWSIPQMEITNGNASEWFDSGDGGTCASFDPGLFNLSINGTTYRLIKGSGSRHTQYRANGDPSLYIEFIGDASVNTITGEYWIVRTADGTSYRFGYEEHSEQVLTPLKGSCGATTANGYQPKNSANFAASSWKLDTITDKYGREIQYIYRTKCGENIQGCRRSSTPNETITESNLFGDDTDPQGTNEFRTESDVALASIEYNFDINGNNPETIVQFNYDLKNSGAVQSYKFPTVGVYRPKELIIEHDSNVIAAYKFSYAEGQHYNSAFDTATQFWWITSITPFGNDYSGGTGTSLPSQTFEYNLEAKGCGLTGPSPSPSACVKLLTSVDNGYGAYTKLQYERMNDSGNQAADGRWFHIVQVDTWDGVDYIYDPGLVSDPFTTTTYDHSNYDPCFERVGATCEIIAPGNGEPSEALVGFTGVDIETLDGSTVLSQQTQEFDTSDYWLSGKVNEAIVYDPTDPDNILSEQLQHWEHDDTTHFTSLEWEKNLTYHPASGNGNYYGTFQEYAYDINAQDNRQWGRPTTVTTKLISNEDPDPDPYYISETRYESRVDLPNDKWLLVPYEQLLIDGVTDLPVQGQLFLYDGQNDPDDQVLTIGQLDLTMTLIIPDDASTNSNWTAITTKNKYFTSGLEKGLVQWTIEYRYPYGVFLENQGDYYLWDYVNVPSPSDTNWRTKVQTDYTSDALNVEWQEITGYDVADAQRTEFTYDTDFYWLPASVTDPNDVSKSFEYDIFGRLTSVKHPDPDAPQNDIEEVSYDYVVFDPDGVGGIDTMLRIETNTYPNETNQNVESNEYYNGLGQLLQQRTFNLESSDGGGTLNHVWIDYEYDALGRLICQTIPRPGSAGTYNPQNCVGSPTISTKTEYDNLGRVIRITSPSGAETYQQYPVADGYLWQSTYDANKHAKRELYDALGRLVKVLELEGNCADYSIPSFYSELECAQHPPLPPEYAWNEYAETVYSYDVRGNLLNVEREVIDGQTTFDVDTTIEYDALGRKQEMDDPDMGSWGYEYDIHGNLTSQIDLSNGAPEPQARLCLYYDSLDRLVRKVSTPSPDAGCPYLTSAPTSGPNHLATYVYDTADGAGIGKLHIVKWGLNPDDNKDVFTYDGRGRLESQTRWIDGQDYTLETLAFNNLDQPTQILYPDGETVIIDYDRMGQNELSINDGSQQFLVNDVTYNSRGQLTFLDLDNGKPTELFYHDNDHDYRLERIQHGLQNDVLPDFIYDYDPVGNIIALTTDSTGTDDFQEFTYDELDRLKQATMELTIPNLTYNYTYNYNELGNIISKQDNINSSTSVYEYDYNVHPHAVIGVDDGSATAEFGYDDNGNMNHREDEYGDYDQIFDQENRLISVVDTSTGAKTDFFYDANGQRVSTIEPDGTVIHTPFPNFEKVYNNSSWNNITVPEADFESDQEWTVSPDANFPGTSISIGPPIEGQAHSFTQTLSIHNLADGYLESQLLAAAPNKTYKVEASLKGEVSSAHTIGNVSMWLVFYNTTVQDEELVRRPIWQDNSFTYDTWQSISNDELASPAGTDSLSIILEVDQIDGWVAFDNISIYEEGDFVPWISLSLVDGSFETSSTWSENIDADYPATSIWRGDVGSFAADDGRYSMVMGNRPHAEISSSLFAMQSPEMPEHRVGVSLIGDFGSSSHTQGGVYLSAHYYGAQDVWLGQETIWSATEWHDKSWQGVIGESHPPSGTISMSIELGNSLTTGSVYFDDVFAEYYGGYVVVQHPVPEPSFEQQVDWSLETNATGSISWDTGSGGVGTHAYSLSNQNRAVGVVQSAVISANITGGSIYEFKAWMRGRLIYGSSNLTPRLVFYNGSAEPKIKYLPPISGGQINDTTWTQVGGQVAAPGDAVEVRLEIFANQVDGWVLIDDVTLREFVDAASVSRSVYSLAGRPIAVRNVTYNANGTVNNIDLLYILSDQLGSHSAFADETGAMIDTDGNSIVNSRDIIRYEPFGDFRGNARPDDITDRSFTGHQDNMEIGLVYMGARYYLPSVGRFVSADTIVPDPSNPQTVNRYSYGYNNPVKYTDPTGHYVVDSDDGEISPPIPVVENNVEEGTHEEGTNYVDITEWLIWQMKWNSQGEDAEILRGYTTLYPDGDRSLAWSKWRDLVKNGSKWDFKPQFRAQSIGYVYIDGIPVRMDIVANIHYGFVGNQVGFTNLELHLGAGIAQQTSGDKAKGDWTYYGDEPADFWAIEFGIHLSRTYGLDVTYDEFIYSFNLYLDAGKFDAYLPPFA